MNFSNDLGINIISTDQELACSIHLQFFLIFSDLPDSIF